MQVYSTLTAVVFSGVILISGLLWFFIKKLLTEQHSNAKARAGEEINQESISNIFGTPGRKEAESPMDDEPVIRTSGLWKNFFIRHNRNNSLKERFIGLFHQDRQEQREEIWALRDVNLEVEKGEMVGLIGPNGSGKSTLLQLIAGTYTPTRGQIEVYGDAAPLIELGVGFQPELTGKENIYLNTSLYGLSTEETDDIFEDIVAFSELEGFIDTKVKNYSSGMYMRLGFSIISQLDPEILLIDEVLAVGDEEFQQKCLAKMNELQQEGKTIIFVSHSMELVEDFCDRAYLLLNGEVAKSGKSERVVHHYLNSVEG